MKTLILDFMRRWWLLTVLVALNVATGLMSGRAPLLPIMIIGLMIDSQSGVLRVTRTLPVPWRTQAHGWWFVGVLLGPLMAPLFLPLALLVPGLDEGAVAWFGVVYGWWVGLGFSALAFLSYALCPNGPAADLASLLKRLVAGLGALVAFPGYMLLLKHLPVHVAELAPWSIALAASVPVVLLCSWLAAPAMPSKRINGGLDLLLKPKPEPVTVARGGLTGSAALLLQMHGRPLLAMIVFGVISYVVSSFLGLRTLDALEISVVQWMTMSAFFCMLFLDSWNLRSLRSLPLSTGRLAALIVCLPVEMGLTCGLVRAILTTVAGGTPSAVSVLALAAAIASLGTATMVIGLYFPTRTRFVLALAAMMLACVGAARVSRLPEPDQMVLAGASVLVVLAGLAVIWRGLKKSSSFYVARRIPGSTWTGMNSQS